MNEELRNELLMVTGLSHSENYSSCCEWRNGKYSKMIFKTIDMTKYLYKLNDLIWMNLKGEKSAM